MRALFLAAVCLALATPAHAQAGLLHSPHFNLTEPNYFLLGLDDPPAPGAYANQIKFRVALRYRIATVGNPDYDQGPYAGYTQTSFWHLWEESAPFFDNNYSPQLFYYFDARSYGKAEASYWPSVRAFIEHESNGRDSASSRSWNRYGLGIDIGDIDRTAIFGLFKAWRPFGIDDNVDIEDYAGRAELALGFQPLVASRAGLGSLGLLVKTRLFGENLVTNSEITLFLGAEALPLDNKMRGAATRLNASLAIQRFEGYAENLLTYRDRHTTWRVGLATVH